jgi:putative DNA methylase
MTDPIETTNQPTRDVQVNATPKKKLIETSLPLEAINAEASREKSIRHGHPSTLHLYWARRPLAAARAVLFAQLVDDPASRPEEFPTVEEQDAERARLHRLLEQLVVWENSNDETLLSQARAEIRKSNNGHLPAVLDPFAGGGAIPLEAQRLGLEAHASDLNPLAVLINKALIEIPPLFTDREPAYPGAAQTRVTWARAEGLAEDVQRYGAWMREEAIKRIGSLYPPVVSPDGVEHTVIAWIWARTVKSPNPANPVEVPLVRSWWLNKKKGKEAWIEASVANGEVRYTVRHDANGPVGSDDGTVAGGNGRAVGDGTVIPNAYIRAEAQAQRLGAHLMAIVAEGNRSRLYFSGDESHEAAAVVDRPLDVPNQEVPTRNHDVDRMPMYGMPTWADAFTNRQLIALTTLSDLVGEVRERVFADATERGIATGDRLEDGGQDAAAYADAIATYLALAVGRQTDRLSSLASWQSQGEKVRNVFGRQAIPMVWDYAEVNPFSDSSGGFAGNVEWVAKAVAHTPASPPAEVVQADAAARTYEGLAISTDPPYYDNIGYSDLSDYFYVWLRRSLLQIQSKTVSTMLTPKAEELVANPYRHNGKAGAEAFFVDGFNSVFTRIRREANPDIPLTVYYAYKQQDTRDAGTSSTGWHTLLGGLIDAGWEITATWPMRSERGGRLISVGTNALASSIVLACRPRREDAPSTTRRALSAALRAELPQALRTLIQGSIAAVDLDQAAIGPGIAVFSRYSRVREADGTDMSVRDALELINATLDEVVDELSDSDPDSRFAAKWYRQFGWGTEVSGTAITMAQSAGTSLGTLERGGIFEAKGGRARLLSPAVLEDEWDVASDERVSVWEATVRLAAVMARDGVDKVAQLLPAVQTRVSLDAVKQMSLWLFREAEKKRDTKDAILFNGLVSAWGDVNEQARKHAGVPRAVQQAFDFDEDGD